METLPLHFILGALAALAMLSVAVLHGWSQWLALKHRELELGAPRPTPRPNPHHAEAPSPTARIELADLKERIRKLEAIAAGVDL